MGGPRGRGGWRGGDGVNELFIGAPGVSRVYRVEAPMGAIYLADELYDEGVDGLGAALATGDLNADGYVDLVETSQEGDGRVIVRYGPTAGGSYLNAPFMEISPSPGLDHLGRSVAVVPDTNNDGGEDLWISNDAAGELLFFDQIAVGTYSTSLARSRARAGVRLGGHMAVGQLDGLGGEDLAVVETGHGVWLLFGE